MKLEQCGEIERCGKIIRILISNHHKSRAVPKSELNKMLNVNSLTMSNLLCKTQQYLQKFNLEITGASPNSFIPYEASDKVFIRKIPSENPKKQKIFVENDDKILFFLFTVMGLENNKLEAHKVSLLDKCKLFKNTKALECLKKFKNQGYFNYQREDEKIIWTYGWRYFIEFDSACDIVKYAQEVDLN